MIFGVQARGCHIDELAFGPDGETLVGLTLGRGVSVWNLPAGTIRGRWDAPKHGMLRSALAPNGARLYFSEGDRSNARLAVLALPELAREGPGAATGALAHLFAAAVPGRFAVLRRTDKGTGKYELAECQVKPSGTIAVRWRQAAVGWYLRAAAYFPGGPLVCGESVLEGAALRLAVRDKNTGEAMQTFPFPKCDNFQLVASPNGKQVVLGSGSHLLSWRDWKHPEKPTRVPSDNRKHFTGMAFHPSGRYLAATSNDKTVKFHDTTTWEVTRTFTWNIGKLRSIAFSPDGTLAAAGSDTGKVVVWDVDL